MAARTLLLLFIINLTNLDFKKLLSSDIQSIKIELRTESGRLIPFTGTGKVVVTLKFQKIN